MSTSAVYKLGERNSHPLTPTITVIPAKAGIHCEEQVARADDGWLYRAVGIHQDLVSALQQVSFVLP